MKNGFVERLTDQQKKIYFNEEKIDQPCKKKFSKFENIKEKICLRGNEDELNIIMLGDSNNMMWFEPFKNLSNEKNLNVSAYKNICNVFPNKSIRKDIKDGDIVVKILFDFLLINTGVITTNINTLFPAKWIRTAQ